MDQHRLVIRKFSLKVRKYISLLIFAAMILSVSDGCAGLKCGKKEAAPAACEKPESSCETNNAPCTPDLPESTISSTTTVSVSRPQEAPEGSVSVVSDGKTESAASNVSNSSPAPTQEPAQPASSEPASSPAPSATSGTSTINYPAPSSEVKQGEIPDQYKGFSNSQTPQNENNGDFINVSNEKSADSSSGKTQYNTIIEGQ